MTMSQNQLRNLGLSYVRRVVASGKYTAADVTKWEAELGPQVHEIVAEGELDSPRPAPSRPAPRRRVARRPAPKKTAPPVPTPPKTTFTPDPAPKE